MSSGSRSRKIPFGPYKGLTLNIDLTSQTQFYSGLWEFETRPYTRAALKESNWLIDVGAGFLFKTSLCHAIAIEPDVRSNLALNRLSDSDIEIVPKYVGTDSDQD